MKIKLVTQFLMSAIALSGAAVSPAMAQYQGQYQQPPVSGQYQQPIPGQYQQPPVSGQYQQPIPGQYPQPSASTSFICGQVGSDPATLVQANGRILSSPLIIWQTASNDMSPQQRCQMVSQRMTATVAQNGGKLSNLLLTTGKVNGFSVICFVNAAESCNPNNVIMTLLRGENARNPGNVLARIVRFGQRGKGANVVEAGGFVGGVGGEEEIIPTAVGLEEAVNQLANESGGMPAAPNPGNYPAPNPGNYTPTPGAGTGGGPI
ncbi:COP23 domain-containing protein [Nostoc sp. DedQUE09]|uniref:COP23 domain-containing protein n=1 Tax=Nostoc sp. DedQUE09 TaxID=3075394 RepID=UPI002AD5786E|nr:COP23 domain-containing protein [Nostoc sp. DedQUE09]MDZ7951180.1 COP23 domain-containing protein [Nostoc sp. DedQUE09]